MHNKLQFGVRVPNGGEAILHAVNRRIEAKGGAHNMCEVYIRDESQILPQKGERVNLLIGVWLFSDSSSGVRNTDQSNENNNPGAVSSWDDTLKLSTQEFQHRDYNILTCNCHSFVANNLNRMRLQGGRWNVIKI
ncbi:hypothetical protein V2J09_000400 [Rumex salicifolius]